jgi:hypothetical protein
MRWRTLAALAMLAAPFASPEAAETDALRAIDACIARLDAQIDVGYERIARRCPDLAPALEHSGFAAWLPQEWKESRNDLSAGSLAELRRLVARELATRATARTPRVERLEEILSDLGSTAQESSGTWARFKKWVRSLFERAGQQESESWLSRLVSRVGVSGAVIEVITYIALGLVVALAGFIVFNELRLAGLLGRRRVGDRSEGEHSIAVSSSRLTWGDVERAALVEQPRLLLQLVAAKLTARGQLPPAGAFTVRELVRTAKLGQEADRQTLNEIALTSERVRYAEGGVPSESVQEAVVRGRELLARLDSPELPATSEARA